MDKGSKFYEIFGEWVRKNGQKQRQRLELGEEG